MFLACNEIKIKEYECFVCELICQATQLLLRQHKTKKRYQHESMRRGYIEMGKINLGIASEAFLAEYEAAHTVERLVSGG